MATDFGKRLAAARKHAGMSQVQAAKALGTNQSTISSSETQYYSSKDTVRFASLYKVNPHWLATGEGEMLPSQSENAVREQPQAYIKPPGMAVIPLLANTASAGPGSTVDLDDDVIVGNISLSPRFLNQQLRQCQPEQLRHLHAHGDSMSPTIESGDVLLVDTDVTAPDVDGIYVLRANSRLYVKRLRTRLDGTVEISSDNPGHKTVDVLDGRMEVAVLGRVVWCWSGRRV